MSHEVVETKLGLLTTLIVAVISVGGLVEIAPRAARLLPTGPLARTFALGMLWGWLPCGLVYSALAAAAVAGGAGQGLVTMVAFGLGTAPAMLGLSLGGTRLPRREGTLARLLGTIIVACGLWTASLPIAAFSGAGLHAHHHALRMPGPGTGEHPAMAMPTP